MTAPSDAELVKKLEDFRAAVNGWTTETQPTIRQSHRSYINQKLHEIHEIVLLSGCLRTITISPPPAIGGVVMENVDPFTNIFGSIYGVHLGQAVKDCIDQAIGVIQSGKDHERKEILRKTTGKLGLITGKKVFLVHGHDKEALETTARYLHKLGLEVIILNEQPSSGMTIIEKIETYSDVAFAVVLLTPDDIGAKKTDHPQYAPRARQNVIFELGYFMAKLSRKRVIGLLKDRVEKPSDYDGVNYIQMDGGDSWKLYLAKEMKAAGLEIDMNNAL
ncbi:MAG: nucleotide-binding protein [Alphaproteobacteria bacterium]|nr:nucleotide-binding protein [Alphaproteobacteria bacterium]